MQLKWKKFLILGTIAVYCASFLIQSNFAFFQAWAKETNVPRVNIVAVLVDDKIYDWIAWWLTRYASEYIQWKLVDTKALVLPLNLKNIKAYDIYRMMENIYFDWLQNVNSSLIGLVMIWDIPLPVVNQDGYVFPTVYPYVDFEDQKYIWDEDSQYFVPNDNPAWQAEIWHWLINYWEDTDAYLKFFNKIKKYSTNPSGFIWDSIWYEDFIAQKEAFLEDNYQYYRNRIMFSEDLWYQRYSPLMKKLFSDESATNSIDIVNQLWESMWVVFEWVDTVKSAMESDAHTTKMVQQEIETSLSAESNELFSKSILSTMRENIFAWWRWIKLNYAADWKASQIADTQNSLSLMQLKDTLYLWNENLMWILENLNLLMEDMVDNKISKNKYDMDIVIPVSFEEEKWKRLWAWLWAPWKRKCMHFVERFDNFYFWRNARYVDSVQDLTIYRWTYRNLENLNWVTYDSLQQWNNPAKSEYDSTDLTLKSIWASYDIFSTQVEWNRWYMMNAVQRDLDIYEEERISKDQQVKHKWLFGRVRDRSWPDECSMDDEDSLCEYLDDFAKRWWWWASPINLDAESVSSWKYKLNWYDASSSWRPIFDMGWFQSLIPWTDEWALGRGWVNWNWVWPQRAATSYKAYEKYASPTERENWEHHWWYYDRYVNNTPYYHGKSFSSMDYYRLPSNVLWWSFKKESANVFNVINERSSSCYFAWMKTFKTKYTYKVISSLAKHVSTTDEEINWVNRNRYWENWTLWIYYRDLTNAYDDVQKFISSVLTNLNDLKNEVNSLNQYISNKINELVNSKNKLYELIKQLNILKIEKLNLENQKAFKERELSILDSEDLSYDTKVKNLKEEIAELEVKISDKERAIKDTEQEIISVQQLISTMLVEVSDKVTSENKKLATVYSLITSLSVDKLFWILEYIAYLEWLNPDDFYNNISNSSKIWLLPQWITSLKAQESTIKSNANSIIISYITVYQLINNQRIVWANLAPWLIELSESNVAKINEITLKFNDIFTVEEEQPAEWEDVDISDTDGEWEEWEEWDWKIYLEVNSATEAINWEWWIIYRLTWVHGLDYLFDWLFQVDTVGPAIATAAMSDVDFRLYLRRNSISTSSFSQDDWINQYATWAQWPWYDSNGAKKNHDLLQWIIERDSWMNILTPDRPIDSPRYVSMQSVAWKEMKFIYPDLYKVEVYTWKVFDDDWNVVVQELLTWGWIKDNLVKYLNWKVDEYNKILENQCNNAKDMSIYYLKLKSLWYNKATPDKWIHGCGVWFSYEEFVDALWGEWMLDTIAEILYYQSLTNKVKNTYWDVNKDINAIKKSFSLNDKRELILADYLTEWMEEKKNPVFLLPTYQLDWYEVGYVNSNWKDYILTTDNINDSKESSASWDMNIQSTDDYLLAASLRSRNNTQPTPQENEMNDECNIPPSWKLPLFELNWLSVSSPWFKWFKCWLKKTKEEPVKVKLTFDSALGEILSADSLSEFIENSDIAEAFTDYWDAMTKYADSRESLIDKDTEFDADKQIVEMQVKADKHNQEEMVTKDWLINNVMNSLNNNIQIYYPNTVISDNTPSVDLQIWSLSDIGNVSVTFMLTWDGSLKLGDDSLVNGGTISKSFNPKTDPLKLSVSTADHKAWKIGLDIKIAIWWNYIEKVIKYTVTPSDLDYVDITFGDKYAVAWMLTPIAITWYDQYDNAIEWWLDKYKFTVSQWRFLKDWSYQESFETNDFRDLNFYYQSPLDAADGSEAVVQISKLNDPSVYIKTQPITVVQWALEVKLNWTVVLKWKENLETDQSYRLKSDESIYVWDKLNVSKLQKLDIDLKDLKDRSIDIDSQVIVTSQNGLVVVGQLQKDDKGNDILFETSKNYMQDGHVTVYYYPTTVAWNDVISIDIPWLESRKINLEVLPAQLANVLLVPEKDTIYIWDSMELEIYWTDTRWNLVDQDHVLALWFGDELDLRKSLRSEGFQEEPNLIQFNLSNWYKKIEVESLSAWASYINVQACWDWERAKDWSLYFNNLAKNWTYTRINVDNHIFPNSGLNIMYLNYFGNDWWNQWWYFSDNSGYVEKLMNKSNKVITTTTQLVSEDKIKKMVWKIQPWFRVWNPDNISTMMLLNGWNIDMLVWWITSMNASIPSLEWMPVTQDRINSLLWNSATAWKNYIFFIPSDDESYSVDKNWVLYNNWERVWNIAWWEVTLQLTDEVSDNGDNIWSVVNKWVDYWTVIFHLQNFVPKVANFSKPGEGYLIADTFSNWSTDALSSVWIFDSLSDFELNTSYRSIQNSDVVEERIWFLWDFKNITLFAEWEIVWEATRKFGSEFVINLWDPVLSRKSKNEPVYGTKFDGWIWTEIFTDSEKDIYWTYEIDFNNDWLKDLLVVYLDWVIKLAKNYWGTPDLRNMQELMRIAVSIKDVFIWDADGNKYDDIIIRTSNNQFRAYLNNWWMFDVDGSVACLNQNVLEWEVTKTPSSLEWVFQSFVEDMDWDGVVDIIIYDNKWYIKVFYGWSTDKWPNYLSTEKYACDDWWYDREKWNTTIVTALWVQVVSDDIFDNSMLHRVWMARPEVKISESELSKYWVEFDPYSIQSLIKTKDRNSDWDISLATRTIIEKFNVKKASEQYVDEWAKFVDVTLYENELLWWWDNGWNNYVFAPSSFLNPNDPNDNGSVRKNYYLKKGSSVLQSGDIVTVRVTVKASSTKTFRWSYWDIIQWPWNLHYDDNGILEWIKFVRNPSNAVVKKKDWNFSYIVDNIILSPNDKLIFEYDLEYRPLPLKTVSLTYDTFYSQDLYPDIKWQCTDGCSKDFDVYINGWKSRSFARKSVPLQSMIDNEYLAEDDMTEDYAADVANIWSDVNQLPWMVWNSISRSSLLGHWAISVSNDDSWKKTLKNAMLNKIKEWWLESFNVNFNIDLNLFEDITDEIDGVIDTITEWMCNWFSFGWSNNCKWLPVPFNQAFLAPGKYHIFGCWELPMWPLEWWLPVFFFPGTIYVLWAPIPFPWWLKWSTDEFIWAPWWAYPSMIRIYAAPTLTAQLWIAICMSPEAIWSKIPSPISDIAGNCVVFAVAPQCNWWWDDDWWMWWEQTDKDNPNDTFPDMIEDVRDSWVCNQSQKWFMVTKYNKRSTPLNLYAYSTNKVLVNNSKDSNTNPTWKNAPSWNNFSLSDTKDVITWNNMNTKWWSNYEFDYDLDLMWIISLETDSFVWASDSFEDNSQNSIVIWDVDILWWDFSINKIRWWLQQWVRKMLIDKWLDPQIRYILNQLTKMHVNIRLPDMSNLIDNEVETLSSLSSSFDGYINNAKTFASDMKQLPKNATKNSWLDNESVKNNFAWNFWSDLKWTLKTATWGVSWWEQVATDTLKNTNKQLANPFEGLATLMNQSNIINISLETLNVKIPMLFSSDINAYEMYLKQRLEVNQWIIEQWKTLIEAVGSNCSNDPNPQQCREEANRNLAAFIEFEHWDWQRMQDQIYANLIILQKYREFPFEIYEWIHVIDTYMAEIAALINNTLWYLSYWISTNSQRFVGYVDAITLILNIVRTYQLIIDFSVEWWQNCGNCAKDTYDQYSCKLSMLCDMIQLPILQIPNFKLPNITLDLTNINIWLDIILPKFNFQPVKISLPELPNLPEPANINIKLFDLPNIPVLPEPPELPELPSFIPEVELALPLLPPAPEIPKLPNTIEWVINIAKMIGKIYCIVKGSFWLVWEMSVKAKIEQLTQRTYEVPWIDKIMDFTNLSAAPIKNYWVDYEIDAELDLQFDLDFFYSYLNTLTKSINNLSTAVTNTVNWAMNDAVNNNAIVWAMESLDSTNINVNLSKLDSSSLRNIQIDWMTSDEIEYVDYDSGKSRLKEVLAYFRKETNATALGDSVESTISKIERQIDRPNWITPNEKWIEDVKKAVISYLDSEKASYDSIADMINNDYDWFLAMVDRNSTDENVKSKMNENQLLTFNVQLFNLDPAAKESISTIIKENPYNLILDNKKEIIDWYWKAINTNTADELWLTQRQYLVLRDNIASMKNKVNYMYNLTIPESSTQLIAKNWTVSNKTLVAWRVGSQPAVASVIDPSVMSKWIYEKITEGKDSWRLTKVVYSDTFAEEMWDTNYRTTHTKDHDIILWDNDAVYKKCYSQNCLNYWWSYKDYFKANTINEIPYEETRISIKDMKLKIADVWEEVKNWKVSGQNYDVLSFSWLLDDSDAYLLKLVERVDSSYEKSDYNLKVPVRYVLALPDYVDVSTVYSWFKLELLNKKIDTIENLSGNALVQIVQYDSNRDTANITISNIDRKWYYMRIASLNLNNDTYNIESPRSNQIVAWRQIVWDDQAPTWEPVLYRPSIPEITSEWDDLEWYVGTKYQLIVNWEDNVALSYINLSQNGKILAEKYTSNVKDSVSIDIDIHTSSVKETYTTKWIDQYGNTVEKPITVSYYIPWITVTDISRNSDWETLSITAELTQDIDQWNVSFQRRRWELRKSMIRTWLDCADLRIWAWDRIIVWSPYTDWNEIAMYDKNGNVMALMNPDTAEIKFQSWYENSYEVNVSVQNSSVLRVCDKKDKSAVFSISLPTTECVKIDAENYTVVDLPEEWKMWMFNGWKAINKDWNVVLLVSPTCHLYSELWLEWEYSYDRWLGAVWLTLYQSYDWNKSSPIKVWFKVKSFTES